MQWSDVVDDPNLHDLPYKIELNEHGQIVMVPHRPVHSRLQRKIARLLEELLPHGEAVPELAIRTSRGTKVADVAWCSAERNAVVFGNDPIEAPVAPEICVEVVSRGNREEAMRTKRALYFESGADEVWLCDEDGRMRFFTPDGERQRSPLASAFPGSVSL